MLSTLRRFALVCTLTGAAVPFGFSLGAVAQSTPLSLPPLESPGTARVGSGAFATTPPSSASIAPITPPPLTIATPASSASPAATGGSPAASHGAAHGAAHGEVKDLTHTVLPGLFDSHASEGHHPTGKAHAEGGHGDEHHHEGSGIYGRAEYLLLRPRRGASDFAIRDPRNDLVPAGAVESMNYELRSGLRAGMGYRFKDSPYAAGFTYTFLRSSSDRSARADAGGVLYPSITRPGVLDQVGFAEVRSSLEYNVFDLEISRRIHIDDRMKLLLYGGARFATIRQDFNANYDLLDANQARAMTRANFDGFGPLLGGEASLKVIGGFHLYAKGSASLLSGKINNSYTETNNDGRTQLAGIDYRTRRVVPVLGAGLGGGWQYHNVAIRVGYEVTNWFNMIDQIRFTNDLAEGKFTTRPADLSLEGLFVQFSITY
jgi:Legionella pneumophila major outer membrane protein precursor